MPKNIKYGKVLVVVFLTVLIWVWADLALDESLPVLGATVKIARSNPALWVSFDDRPSVSVEEIVLKGPSMRIAELDRNLKKGQNLVFDFDAVREGMADPGPHSLVLLPFLQKDKEIKRLGLKVERCKPDKLSVKVVGLVEKKLEVRCEDDDQNPIPASIEPKEVFVPVPEDVGGGFAQVQLTAGDIEQARGSYIKKTPHFKLADGQITMARTPVKITMPAAEDPRQDRLVEQPTLAVALSVNLQARYEVIVTNYAEVTAAFEIRATLDAWRVFQAQLLPSMTLYIYDDDVKKGTEEQSREVVYNFPPEFFRKGEIDLKSPSQPRRAKFKLRPLTAAGTPPTGAQ
ncbi:MAG TPA: hypothetical protein VMW16_13645 [Sedimentisphaerales bacterium]|nr:hypothetical protein [Sedimentisphaerales bacterium]